MNRKTKVGILKNSNIINLVTQNKNKSSIRQEITKQSGHELSYSIINRYIEETLKKTWQNKKWVDIKSEDDYAIPTGDNVTSSKEISKITDLTPQELDKKLLLASNNLDTIDKEEMINYLQTILKYNYRTSNSIKRLEKKLLTIEATLKPNIELMTKTKIKK